MRFTINLTTRTYLDNRLINRVCFVVLSVLAILLVWNVSRASWGYGDLNRLKAENALYEARLNSRPKDVSEKDYDRLLADVKYYNDIISRKSYNWLGLLDQLENSIPDGVALVNVIPDKKTGILKIEGRTRKFDQVRAYLEKLEESRSFRNILLLSHKEVVFSDKQHGVEFAISCRMVTP